MIIMHCISALFTVANFAAWWTFRRLNSFPPEIIIYWLNRSGSGSLKQYYRRTGNMKISRYGARFAPSRSKMESGKEFGYRPPWSGQAPLGSLGGKVLLRIKMCKDSFYFSPLKRPKFQKGSRIMVGLRLGLVLVVTKSIFYTFIQPKQLDDSICLVLVYAPRRGFLLNFPIYVSQNNIKQSFIIYYRFYRPTVIKLQFFAAIFYISSN